MSKNDYIIPLKKAYDNKPSKRRANYAVRLVYEFLKKHTRKETKQVIISEEVNNFLWSNSIQRPPRKISVSLRFKDDLVYVFLKDSKNALSFGKEDVSKKSKTKTKKTKEEKPKDKPETKEEKPKDKPETKEEKPKDKPETKEEKPKDKPETKEKPKVEEPIKK
jgi:ribosomal protein L31E